MLTTLGDADAGLSYELRECVDVRDNGKFHYVDDEGSVRRSACHTKFTARETWFDRPVES